MTPKEAKLITAYFDADQDVKVQRPTAGLSLLDLSDWMLDPIRTDIEVIMAWQPFSSAQLWGNYSCEEHSTQMARLIQAGVTERIIDAIQESRRQFPWKK